MFTFPVPAESGQSKSLPAGIRIENSQQQSFVSHWHLQPGGLADSGLLTADSSLALYAVK
jgi:hypothetical protein